MSQVRRSLVRFAIVANVLWMLFLSDACSGVDSEAGREAQKAWDQYFTKCGNSYYTAQSSQQVLGVTVTPNMIEEDRGVVIETKKSP